MKAAKHRTRVPKVAADVEKYVRELFAIEASCKLAYNRRDEIEAKLIARIQDSKTPLRLSDGRFVLLKDNFLDRDGRPRNVAFKTAAVKRFEICVGLPPE
jgi:hypothetical protein